MTYPFIGGYVNPQGTPVLKEASSVEGGTSKSVGVEGVDGTAKPAGMVVPERDLGARHGKELGGMEKWSEFC